MKEIYSVVLCICIKIPLESPKITYILKLAI